MQVLPRRLILPSIKPFPQAVGLSKRLLLRLFFSNAGIAAAADFAVYQRKRRLD
jgi:hypothetical protein